MPADLDSIRDALTDRTILLVPYCHADWACTHWRRWHEVRYVLALDEVLDTIAEQEEAGIEADATGALSIRSMALKHNGTDAGRIRLHTTSVPSLALGVPCRHICTHAGMISAPGYQNALRLVTEVCEVLGEDARAGMKP